jgi:hypothetical protein
MLVTFRTEAFASVTMFGDVAVTLIKLMGHSGAVPSALMPEDIPEALERLKAAVAANPETRLILRAMRGGAPSPRKPMSVSLTAPCL